MHAMRTKKTQEIPGEYCKVECIKNIKNGRRKNVIALDT